MRFSSSSKCFQLAKSEPKSPCYEVNSEAHSAIIPIFNWSSITTYRYIDDNDDDDDDNDDDKKSVLGKNMENRLKKLFNKNTASGRQNLL